MTEIVDISATVKHIFIGYADRGTATTEGTNAGTLAAWRILRIVEESGTNGDGKTFKSFTRAWANGSETARVVWADRSSLTYTKFGR